MVLYSTEQSIETNEVSALAIFEIIIAVTIYWGIAWYFDVYLHIIASICIAPLLLFRSDQSTKMALKLFYNNISANYNHKFSTIKLIFIYFLIFIFYFLLTDNITIFFIDNVENSKILVDKTFLMILILSPTFIGLWYFLVKDGLTGITIAIIGSFIGIIHSLGLEFTNINKTSIVAIGGGIAAATIILLLLLLILWKKNTNIIGKIVKTFPVGLAGFGIAFIIIVGSVVFKIIATIRYIKDGYSNFINNWYYSNFIIDINKTPEIIPGIEKDDDIDSSYKISQLPKIIIKNKDYLSFILLPITYIVFYSFAIFYRISIKSTFWFYIPLLLLVRTPDKLEKNSKKIAEFLSNLHGTHIAITLSFIAIINILAFIITYFDYPRFYELNSPLKSILAILYLDFSSLEILKILQLLIAILTIILFFWSNKIRAPKIDNKLPLELNFELKSIFFTNNIRNALSFFYFLFALIYMNFHFQIWEYHYILNSTQESITKLVEFIRYKPFIN